MRQLRNIANLPWVHGVAVMPDVHYGKGATVGSVIAMRQASRPAAVGVDIGCGMSAVRHLADRRRPARRPRPPCGAAIEAADPGRLPRARRRRSNPARVHGCRRGWDAFWAGFGDLTAASSSWRSGRARRWARSAAATTSSRSASSRAAGRGPGVADAALGFAQHRQGAGRAAHRRRPPAAAQRRPAGPRPGGVRRRHAGDGGLPAATCPGRRTTPRATGRRHAGAVLRAVADACRAVALRRRRSRATTTTWPRRRTTAWSCW